MVLLERNVFFCFGVKGIRSLVFLKRVRRSLLGGMVAKYVFLVYFQLYLS